MIYLWSVYLIVSSQMIIIVSQGMNDYSFPLSEIALQGFNQILLDKRCPWQLVAVVVLCHPSIIWNFFHNEPNPGYPMWVSWFALQLKKKSISPFEPIIVKASSVTSGYLWLQDKPFPTLSHSADVALLRRKTTSIYRGVWEYEQQHFNSMLGNLYHPKGTIMTLRSFVIPNIFKETFKMIIFSAVKPVTVRSSFKTSSSEKVDFM